MEANGTSCGSKATSESRRPLFPRGKGLDCNEMNRNAFSVGESLRGFSRALFSTWLYHRRFNILFDAGEGVASYLLNRVFGIRKIFLSHGHADHIAGLVNLINIRNLGAGDQTTELEIFYPRNNLLIEMMKNYLSQTQNELSFGLFWKPIEAGEDLQIDSRRGKTFLRTFRTQHSHKQLSLGYNIVEFRRRLKHEFVGKSQVEINECIRKLGKEHVAESFEQKIFSYGGDSRPINPDLVKGSLLLCHECTYLKMDDDERNFQQHSVMEEVLQVAQAAEVKALLLFHLSLRYSLEEIRECLQTAVRKMGVPIRVFFLHGDRFYEVNDSGFSKRRINSKEETIDREDAMAGFEGDLEE